MLEKHILKNILDTYSSFWLVSRSEVRTKIKGSLKGIELYFENSKYIEAETNCPGVSNREKFRLYPLKPKMDTPAYSWVHLFSLLFLIDLISVAFICFVSYPCVKSIWFCVISLAINVKALITQFWQTNSYSTGFKGLLVLLVTTKLVKIVVVGKTQVICGKAKLQYWTDSENDSERFTQIRESK